MKKNFLFTGGKHLSNWFFWCLFFCVLFFAKTSTASDPAKVTNAVFLSSKKIGTENAYSIQEHRALGRFISLQQIDEVPKITCDSIPLALASLNTSSGKAGYELFYRVYIDPSLGNKIMGLSFSPSPYTRIWWDGELIVKEGVYDSTKQTFVHERNYTGDAPFYSGKPGWHQLLIRQVGTYGLTLGSSDFTYDLGFYSSFRQRYVDREKNRESLFYIFLSEGFRFYLLGIFIVSLLFYFLVQGNRAFLWFSVFSFSVLVLCFSHTLWMRLPFNPSNLMLPSGVFVGLLSAFSLLCFLFTLYQGRIPIRIYFYFGIFGVFFTWKLIAFYYSPPLNSMLNEFYGLFFLGLLISFVSEIIVLFIRGLIKKYEGVNVIGLGIFQFAVIMPMCSITINGTTLINGEARYLLTIASLYYLPTSFLISLILVIKKNFEENLGRQQKVIDLTRAQEKILAEQNVLLEQQVTERTHELREEKLKVEEKNTEILDSINYAERIQRAILPSHANMRKHFPDMFLLYLPKDIVAGDFYWMQDGGKTHPGWVFFAVCDCTGHGVPGALLSLVCSKALNKAIEFCTEPDPGKILDVVTELVSREFSENKNDSDQIYDGMDVSFCAFHRGQMQLRWAGANNPLWLVKNSGDLLTLNEVKPDKQAIGINDDIRPFMSHSFQLRPGDCLYLFSDGYADQFGGSKSKKFSSPAMRELIMEHCEQAMHVQQEKMKEAHEHWKGNLLQVDDICVWGIRF
ncbi:MAG: SpoIIE family protein phosphatase [Bacteroidota bacterium]